MKLVTKRKERMWGLKSELEIRFEGDRDTARRMEKAVIRIFKRAKVKV